ncbi:hypothetical protein [Vibrio sp. WXL103]|uniref:hypothetical protein n=1 Tax=Vibrio sp. WXL103 TaxID=3450710 RepID=UPI003EC64778
MNRLNVCHAASSALLLLATVGCGSEDSASVGENCFNADVWRDGVHKATWLIEGVETGHPYSYTLTLTEEFRSGQYFNGHHDLISKELIGYEISEDGVIDEPVRSFYTYLSVDKGNGRVLTVGSQEFKGDEVERWSEYSPAAFYLRHDLSVGDVDSQQSFLVEFSHGSDREYHSDIQESFINNGLEKLSLGDKNLRSCHFTHDSHTYRYLEDGSFAEDYINHKNYWLDEQTGLMVQMAFEQEGKDPRESESIYELSKLQSYYVDGKRIF